MLKPVRRHGAKYWVARGTIDGRRIERSTGCARKGDAERKCREFEDEERQRQGGRPAERPTFAKAVTYYLSLGHDPRFLQPLLDHFGKTPVQDITGSAVQEAAAAIYPGRKNSTIIRQVYAPMTAILNLAAVEGWCAHPKFKRPKVVKPVMKAASVDWFKALLPELPDRLSALLAFMAVTGCRTSEALFADFDLPHRTAIIGRDKNGNPKVVEYPVWVQVMIANLPRSDTASIFGYAERRSVYGTLRRACARAGIPYLTPHQAGRHTFATNLLAAGKSLAFVMKAGHWASGRLVMDTYGHLERSDVARASVEVGENWGKSVAGEVK